MKKYLALFSLMVIIPSAVYSWSDHMYYSREALSVMQEVTGAENVKVEKLEDFLKKESAGLAVLLKEQDEFLKKTYSVYPPLPESLMFDGKDSANIKVNFLKAIRVNPEIRLGYYLQNLPGADISKKNKVDNKTVSVFKDIAWLSKYIFTGVNPGDKAAPLEVLSTASDEPDYGHDIHLFEDNNSESGKTYKFGVQPFGDPKLEYASQAPFHMGYYHESFIIFAAAGFLKQTYPEIRVYQYLELSKFAFKTGHPYWGWRFLGWGLHYVQDLSQPYHTKVLPGYGTTRMLIINLSKEKSAKAVDNLSDRHLSLENFIYQNTLSLYEKKSLDAPFFSSLRDTVSDSKYSEFNENYSRDEIAEESFDLADDLDDAISSWSEIIKFKDKNYHLENFTPTEESREIDNLIEQMMKNYGTHSRNFVRAALKEK